jgi:Leucine-rich repeat (LRR) protein
MKKLNIISYILSVTFLLCLIYFFLLRFFLFENWDDKTRVALRLQLEEMGIKYNSFQHSIYGDGTLLLNISGQNIHDLSGLKYMPIKTLNISNTQVTNISFLENCDTLRELEIRNTSINDLTPLKNLQDLEKLWIINTKVTDLSPLKNIGLEELNILSNNIKDISHINLSNLEFLTIQNTKITDLSVLKTNKLFYFDFSVDNIPDDENGLDVVRTMTNCYINMLPYEQFWQKYKENHKKQ